MVWPWRLAAVIAVPRQADVCVFPQERPDCRGHGGLGLCRKGAVNSMENGVRAILVHAGDGRKIGMILPH